MLNFLRCCDRCFPRRFLINDRVGKLYGREGGADPADRFGMTKEDGSARQQAVVERIQDLPPRLVVEVDQRVAAKYEVHCLVLAHR